MREFIVGFLVLLALVGLSVAQNNLHGQERRLEAHPTDCSAYYELQLHVCPRGSLFNIEEQKCDSPGKVNCDCRGEGNPCEKSPGGDKNDDQHGHGGDDHGEHKGGNKGNNGKGHKDDGSREDNGHGKGDQSNKDDKDHKHDDYDSDSEEGHESNGNGDGDDDDNDSSEEHGKNKGHSGGKGHGDGNDDSDGSSEEHGKNKGHPGGKGHGGDNDDDDGSSEEHGKNKGHPGGKGHGDDNDDDDGSSEEHGKNKGHPGGKGHGDDDDDDDGSSEEHGKNKGHPGGKGHGDGNDDDDGSSEDHGKNKGHPGGKGHGDDDDDNDGSSEEHGKNKGHPGGKGHGDDNDDDDGSSEEHGKNKGHPGGKGHGDGNDDDDGSSDEHGNHKGHHSDEKDSHEDHSNSVCNKLERSQHGKWTPRQCSKKSQKLGHVCKLACSRGFYTSGGSQVRCTESGWEGENGVNIIPTCMSGDTTTDAYNQSTESSTTDHGTTDDTTETSGGDAETTSSGTTIGFTETTHPPTEDTPDYTTTSDSTQTSGGETTTTVEETSEELLNILYNIDGDFEQVLFIVDSSQNVGEDKFYRTELNFVKVITELLFSKISFFGLTTYNDVADVVIPLAGYGSSGFIRRVDNVQYSPRDGSDMANVLDRSFSDIRRSGHRTLVVVISGTESSTDASGEARLIQNQGNTIIPVVVGEVIRNTAISVSSKNEEGSSQYFVFQNWEIFSSTTNYISQGFGTTVGVTATTQTTTEDTSDYTTTTDSTQTSGGETTTTVEEISDEFLNILNSTDGDFEQVLFIVDSSQNVGEDTFYRTELNFVKVITELLFSRISSFGLTTYNDVADVEIALADYGSSAFIERVDNVQYSPRDGSDMANVLDRSFADIRRSGLRTLIVLVSGTESSTDASGEARLIQNQGNIIFPVVVGEVNRNTANSVSSKNEEGSSLYFVFQSWESFSSTTIYISQNYGTTDGTTHTSGGETETTSFGTTVGVTATTQTTTEDTSDYTTTTDSTQTSGGETTTTVEEISDEFLNILNSTDGDFEQVLFIVDSSQNVGEDTFYRTELNFVKVITELLFSRISSFGLTTYNDVADVEIALADYGSSAFIERVDNVQYSPRDGSDMANVLDRSFADIRRSGLRTLVVVVSGTESSTDASGEARLIQTQGNIIFPVVVGEVNRNTANSVSSKNEEGSSLYFVFLSWESFRSTTIYISQNYGSGSTVPTDPTGDETSDHGTTDDTTQTSVGETETTSSGTTIGFTATTYTSTEYTSAYTTTYETTQTSGGETTTTVEEISDEFLNILNNTDDDFEQVLFIVDSSQNVGEDTFYRTELNFVKVITELLFSKISSFGLTTYNGVADVVIPLADYGSSAFIERVDNVQYSPRDGSDMANVLDRSFSVIRRSGLRTLVVVVSGTESSTDASGEARLIQTQGNIIIPVVVGEVNRNTANSVSSKNEDGSSMYFVFQSWESFSSTTTYISQNYGSGSTVATEPTGDETSVYDTDSTEHGGDVTSNDGTTGTTQSTSDGTSSYGTDDGNTGSTQSASEETSNYETTTDVTITNPPTSEKASTCDALENIENGQWESSSCSEESSAEGTVCRLVCASGFDLSGAAEVRCTARGWESSDDDNQLPACMSIEEIGEEVVSFVNGTFKNVEQVLFIVDSSQNVGESTFYDTELNFVKVITEAVFSGISYFGLITYNDYVDVAIPFTEFESSEFIERVNSIQYSPRDGSDMANVLDRAFSEIRRSGRRTLVVFISGTESSSDGSGEATLITRQGNFILPVFVGEVNRNTAISISSSNEAGNSVYFVFQSWEIFNATTTYIRDAYISDDSTEEVYVCQALENSQRGHWEVSNCSLGISELGTVCELVCEEGYELSCTPQVVCNQSGWVSYEGDRKMPSCKTIEEIGEDFIANINRTLWRPANLMFIVDGSGSLTEEEFGLETGLVNAIVRAFPLSEDRSAGVITFSSDATVDVSVSTDDTCTFISDVSAIRYPRGGTNLAEALQLANSELEQNAVHDFTVTILITDGISTTDPREPAAILKRGDNVLFAIGVGDYDAEQLISIATYFYPIRDFGIFDSLKNVLETEYANRTNVQC